MKKGEKKSIWYKTRIQISKRERALPVGTCTSHWNQVQQYQYLYYIYIARTIALNFTHLFLCKFREVYWVTLQENFIRRKLLIKILDQNWWVRIREKSSCKSFRFFLDKLCSGTWTFIGLERLSSWIVPIEIKSMEIQFVIHFIHRGTKEIEYSLLSLLSAAKWNFCLSMIKNRVFCISPQGLSNNVDVTRNPYANFASFQTGKRAMKFALFYSSRLPDFVLSWAQRVW